mmetsp:Transcript_3974/g.12986  ORF Transcript_3974/g.12986 Transcript_3974/m.12986 type:complete len:211 (-) Transcript_3974:1818-2450(-)
MASIALSLSMAASFASVATANAAPQRRATSGPDRGVSALDAASMSALMAFARDCPRSSSPLPLVALMLPPAPCFEMRAARAAAEYRRTRGEAEAKPRASASRGESVKCCGDHESSEDTIARSAAEELTVATVCRRSRLRRSSSDRSMPVLGVCNAATSVAATSSRAVHCVSGGRVGISAAIARITASTSRAVTVAPVALCCCCRDAEVVE